MTVSFELPDLGEDVAEGEVLAWYVDVGDSVDEDDVLAEVETEKAAVEVPSPAAGRIVERHADVGDIVETGSVLVTIDDEAAGAADEGRTEAVAPAADSKDADAPESVESSYTFAPPSVRRLARELGVDLETIEGSGPGGRITEGNVRDAARAAEASAEETDEDADRTDAGPAVRSAVRRVSQDENGEDGEDLKSAVRPVTEETETAPEQDESADRGTGEDTAGGTRAAGTEPTGATTSVPKDPDDHREEYSGIRRRIGEQMGQGWKEVPHATHHDRVEVSELVEARGRLAPLALERDVELTDTPIVVKCVAAALEEHPIINTHFDAGAEEIVFKDAINVGVATATDRGLVPVIEDAHERGLIELAAELTEYVAAARDGSIERSAMEGATFTVSNVGAIGGEYATPIVHVPQTAILATGALRERPVVVEGQVQARPTLPLSLAFDRRVIDGADAARFVNTLTTYLQDPTRLLLG